MPAAIKFDFEAYVCVCAYGKTVHLIDAFNLVADMFCDERRFGCSQQKTTRLDRLTCVLYLFLVHAYHSYLL